MSDHLVAGLVTIVGIIGLTYLGVTAIQNKVDHVVLAAIAAAIAGALGVALPWSPFTKAPNGKAGP